MQLAHITTDFVETCLRNLRRTTQPEPAVLDLCLLEDPANDSAEARMLRLYDLLERLATEAYLEQRRAELLPAQIPNNRPETLEQIQLDFNQGNGDMEAWSALYFRYLAFLPISVEELSGAAHVVPQQFRRRINTGLAYLTQHLRRLEMQAWNSRTPSGQFLPLPDFTRLVGAAPYLEQLGRLFTDPAGPAMVSLEGIGGIGKTALARAFAARPEIARLWKNILWVSARQYYLAEGGQLAALDDPASTLEDITSRLVEQLGLPHLSSKPVPERLEAIQAALNLEPYLVVVDNLETVEEYTQLIPALAQCAGTSRFLITTRQTLRQFPFVHTMQLFELNFQSACSLVEAETTRLGRMIHLPKESCEELYALVGGVPLAIKLAAAQLHLQPLSVILEDFRSAKGNMDEVYRYLYWQTWQMLGDSAQRLLLSFLPADPEGEDLPFIQMMSGMAEDAFKVALQELDQFSLLEITGDVERTRYRLHRLTVTFLQTDILSTWSGTP